MWGPTDQSSKSTINESAWSILDMGTHEEGKCHKFAFVMGYLLSLDGCPNTEISKPSWVCNRNDVLCTHEIRLWFQRWFHAHISHHAYDPERKMVVCAQLAAWFVMTWRVLFHHQINHHIWFHSLNSCGPLGNSWLPTIDMNNTRNNLVSVRLFTVPYFFVRSLRYSTSYR